MPDKIMLITGTRKGIGRYLAEYYLSKDMVVVGCSRTENDLDHDCYKHYCLDVADEQAVKKMIYDVANKYNRIDYLINNAGIASMNHSILTPISVVEKVFRTNVFGTFLFCREVAKVMIRSSKGRIVNFSTVATPLRLEGESVYAASKAAVVSITQVLAKELAPHGILVNAIGPTPVYTDLIKNVPKAKIDSLLNSQAIKRFGEFSDISNVIDFFIQESSDFVTGQILYLGGIAGC